MFIELLSSCTVGIIDASLASNSKESIKCVSLNNEPCQTRPTPVNINSNQVFYYQFTVSVNKYCGSCNTILIYMLE